jgi:hypothetical protein
MKEAPVKRHDVNMLTQQPKGAMPAYQGVVDMAHEWVKHRFSQHKNL